MDLLPLLPQALADGLLLGGVYAIVAVGLTMTFGVLRIVNFAHGDFLAVGLYLTYIGATLLGLDPYLSLVLVLPLVTLAAAFTYKLLIAPVIQAPEHNQIVVTLGLSLILQNAMLVFFTADLHAIPSLLSGQVVRLGNVFIQAAALIARAVQLCQPQRRREFHPDRVHRRGTRQYGQFRRCPDRRVYHRHCRGGRRVDDGRLDQFHHHLCDLHSVPFVQAGGAAWRTQAMRRMLLLALAAALLAGIAPLLSIYGQHIFVLVALYGSVALAWNILGGMAGQMSLGHALFVGAGAYASTALYLNLAVSPWIGLVVAAVIGGALGAVMGYTVFRRKLSGVYFALVTLAVAEMALHIVSNVAALGAANGLAIPSKPDFANLQFSSK